MKKGKKMKKFLALVLALVMLFAFTACSPGEETKPTATAGGQATSPAEDPVKTTEPAKELSATEADWALADELRAVFDAWEEGSDWTVAYICKGLDGTWFSTEFAEVERVCLEMGASKVIPYDCQYDATKQIEFTENALAQGVDFIIFVPVDENVSTAVVRLCVDAGVPCVAEDDPLVGTDGKTRITPSFQLDAYKVGYETGKSLAQWALDNDVLGLDDDYSTVGLMNMDCTIVSSFAPRSDGISDGWLEVFPDFPVENILRPETETTMPDESFGVASAALTSAPDFDLWFLTGINDETTVGALRAFEDMGRDDNLYAAALGAYYANAEWDVYGEASPFVVGYYLSATADGNTTATAVMEYLQTGKIPFDEYVETQEEDWPFGWYPYTGIYVDYYNYVEVITEIEGSYTPATEVVREG